LTKPEFSPFRTPQLDATDPASLMAQELAQAELYKSSRAGSKPGRLIRAERYAPHELYSRPVFSAPVKQFLPIAATLTR
jgi:hypothetical protein